MCNMSQPKESSSQIWLKLLVNLKRVSVPEHEPDHP